MENEDIEDEIKSLSMPIISSNESLQNINYLNNLIDEKVY
jgi:hypothetical protein